MHSGICKMPLLQHRMCELLQSGEQSGERAQAANSLSALLSGGSRRRAEVWKHIMHCLLLHLPGCSTTVQLEASIKHMGQILRITPKQALHASFPSLLCTLPFLLIQQMQVLC